MAKEKNKKKKTNNHNEKIFTYINKRIQKLELDKSKEENEIWEDQEIISKVEGGMKELRLLKKYLEKENK